MTADLVMRRARRRLSAGVGLVAGVLIAVAVIVAVPGLNDPPVERHTPAVEPREMQP